MTIDEIRTYFEENKTDKDVKDLTKELTKDHTTLDTVKGFLESNEDGKSYINKISDSKVSKGIESWKTNNLKDLVDAEVKKQNPELSDEQKELNKLRSELETEKAERVREKLMNKALSIASEKNLPVSIIGNFLGKDEDTTSANIDILKTAIDEVVTKELKKKIPDYSSDPDHDDNKSTTLKLEDVRNMSREELLKNANKIKALK